jgi:hypothetical protein
VDYVSDGFLLALCETGRGNLGKSEEYRMERNESAPHDFWSSEGDSPSLCRLRITLVEPPATSIDFALTHMGYMGSQNLVASTVAELDDTIPRFMDD